ncbi:hypothetical protein Tco_0971056 [Tanacetum coccineum]
MPQTSTPPTIEESCAKLADTIDKLELVKKRLAASTANLVSITSHILLPGPPHLTIQVHTYPQTPFVLTSIARSLNIVPNNKVPDARGGKEEKRSIHGLLIIAKSRTMSPRRQRRSRSPPHNPSVFTRLRRERSRSLRHEYKSNAGRESTVFKRLGSIGRSTSVYSDSR